MGREKNQSFGIIKGESLGGDLNKRELQEEEKVGWNNGIKMGDRRCKLVLQLPAKPL